MGDFRGVHDPCLIREGEWFWLFSTGRGIPVRRSRDLVRWERVGEVFPGKGDIWAPDITFRNGRFVLHYCLSRFGKNHSVVAKASTTTLDPSRPDYGWRDDGVVLSTGPKDNWNAIDPNFIDGGGEGLWLAAGSFWSGIKLWRLDSTTGKPKTGEKPLTLAYRPEEPHAVEAPYVFRRGTWWYALVSFDLCCKGVDSTYNLRMGRAAKLTAPFADRSGKRLDQGGGTVLLQGRANVCGPGHGAVLQDQGTDWLAFHYYDAHERGIPTLGLRKLRWSSDGWPSVGDS